MSGQALTFCPQCGVHRVGALRFCRGCGFDFDSIVSPPTNPPNISSAAPVATRIPPPPVDGQAQVRADRAQTEWTCLSQAMLVVGGFLGLLAGAWLAFGLLRDANVFLQLLVGLVVGPIAGGVVAWWLWAELWARR